MNRGSKGACETDGLLSLLEMIHKDLGIWTLDPLSGNVVYALPAQYHKLDEPFVFFFSYKDPQPKAALTSERTT